MIVYDSILQDSILCCMYWAVGAEGSGLVQVSLDHRDGDGLRLRQSAEQAGKERRITSISLKGLINTISNNISKKIIVIKTIIMTVKY